MRPVYGLLRPWTPIPGDPSGDAAKPVVSRYTHVRRAVRSLPRATVRRVDDATVEAALAERAAEHHCALMVERLEHGLVRAALKTSGHPIDADGAIRLSAARVDRQAGTSRSRRCWRATLTRPVMGARLGRPHKQRSHRHTRPLYLRCGPARRRVTGYDPAIFSSD